MSQAREKERVDVLGLPRTRNDAARKYVSNFVPFVRSKIQDNPYIDPAVRLFIAKQLCTIHREHQDSIVVFNLIAFHGVEIVRSAQDVVPDIVSILIAVSKDVPSLLPPVMHLLRHFRTPPTRLKLRTNGKRCERLLRDLCFATRFLEFVWVVSRFVTPRALL